MNRFFSSKGLYADAGITFIRILVGLFLVYHGMEVFDSVKMIEYAGWEIFKNSSFTPYLAYLGKTAEFVAGLLLIAGLFTRLACTITIGTMVYITFIVGTGKFWYEDQYPFLFAVLALFIFFTGAGTKSMDFLLFDKSRKFNNSKNI
jgi:putative oxidoreductase